MTTLGRYQLFDKIGTGSMGTVYRAKDTILEREVALKTIRAEGDIHPELRERFYREARACARLQHPSIVVVHDLGEVDRVAYIAMELLDGDDFRKLISQRVEIPLPTKLEVMAQVCDALAYAHRRGIIHRDIKPSNLFLIDKKHAKVVDFGIARLPSSHLTEEGKILGTPNYMAPEQVLGKPTDGRSDLFSAAVVFFEFLAYAHPFQGDSIPRRIVEDAPDPLGASERKLPILLERVFARGLAKEPDRRYQTGDEFAADLRALADLLLQNASPSFSRAPLPSERDVAGRGGAPGEDLDDGLSELMQLIPEFEGAMAQGDTTQARQILARLEAIAAADFRCAEPVRLCRARLAEVEPAAGSALPPGPPEQTKATAIPVSAAPLDQAKSADTKMCGYCGAANRSAAAHCIQCGARLTAGTPATAEPAPPPAMPSLETEVEPSFQTTAVFRGSTPSQPVQAPLPARDEGGQSTGAATAPAVEAPQPAAPPTKRVLPQERLRGWWRGLPGLVRKQKQVAWLAAGLLAAIVVMIVVAESMQPIPREHEVAYAQVKPKYAPLYAEPNAKAKAIIMVPRGETINILKIPGGPDQPWVPVQLVRDNKAKRPGYMRTADLAPWHSRAATFQLRLMLLFPPTEPVNDDQIQQTLYDLQHLIDRVGETQDSRKARVYMAKLELILAHNMKDAGRPEGDWRNHVDSAQKDLDAGVGGADADDYRKQIADLTAQPPPTVIEKAQPTPVTGTQPVSQKKKIERLLKDAGDAYYTNLSQAENDVDNALEMQPDNKDAQRLQERIRRRKEALEKIHQ